MKNFYHIGIVVRDINTAMADYKKNYGVAFSDPTITKLRVRSFNDITEEVDVTVSYSRDGPPYVEFIQAVGDSIFSEKNLDKILYYGLWEKDIAKRIEQLNEESIAIEALISKGNNPANAIITAPNSQGVRIEYVSTVVQGYVRAWSLTGKVPGTYFLATVLAEVFSVFYYVKNIFK